MHFLGKIELNMAKEATETYLKLRILNNKLLVEKHKNEVFLNHLLFFTSIFHIGKRKNVRKTRKHKNRIRT